MKDKLWVDSEVKSNLFIDFEVSLTTLVSFFFVNRFRISDIQISRYWKFESSLPFESIFKSEMGKMQVCPNFQKFRFKENYRLLCLLSCSYSKQQNKKVNLCSPHQTRSLKMIFLANE